MTSALIVTVGGSPRPIVTAAETLKPERVVFVCSGGSSGSESQVIAPGKPCKIFSKGEVISEMPNLPTWLALGERFDPARDLVVVDGPDDPAACYRAAGAAIRALLREFRPEDVGVDYTGGTKSMSLGLAMAAVDHGVTVYVTTAARRENLRQVEWGESTERVDTGPIDVARKLNQFLPVFLAQYNYPAAIAQLQAMLTGPALPGAARGMVRDHLDYCKALDAWDKFDHSAAFRLISRFMGRPEITPLVLFLKRVMASRAAIDTEYVAVATMGGHGYEVVEDLVRNAGRRAAQARFDDAVGRLYRALELLAQVRLKQARGIETGNVALDKLPESLKPRYAAMKDAVKGEIRLGLRNSYELLAALDGDPLGELYGARGNALMDKLEIRNQSILAHGFRPVTAAKHDAVAGVFVPFIRDGVAACVDPKKRLDPVDFPAERVF